MFRQSVNMWAGSFWNVVVRSCRVWCMAIIYARRIFCSPGNLFAILRFLKGLYIPYHAYSYFHYRLFVCLGELNDPLV